MMRPVIRLAGGLAAAPLLLLAFAGATYAAEPIVTIDASGGTSSGGNTHATAVANVGTSSATVTLGASAPATTGGDADGNATVTLGAVPSNTGGGADGSAAVSLGAGDGADGSATVTLGSPATAGGAFGSALVTLGAGDEADGSATVTLGAGAPTTGGEPTSGVGAISSGLASLMSIGGAAAEDTTGAAPGIPAVDGAIPALSPFGLLAFGGSGGAPSASGGSGGSGNAVTSTGDAGNGALPETSAEALASGLGIGLPMLALLVGLLAGGLVARRRSEVR